jgi:hypothetical protein
MRNVAQHVCNVTTGIAFVPAPVEIFSDAPELNNKVPRQVFRAYLAPFLLPKSDQGGFIGTHNDSCVRAASLLVKLMSD